MAERDLGKKSMILEVIKALNSKKEPILGLSFITEFQSLAQVMCVCNLCGVKFDHNASLSHVTGSKHRYQYMKEKRPMEYVHLKRFGGKKSQLVNFLQELSFDVVHEDGKGKPVIKVFEEETLKVEKDQKDWEDNAESFKDEDENARDQKSKDQEGNDDNINSEKKKNVESEPSFYNWVESAYKKSRDAHDQRKSPSPPPGERYRNMEPFIGRDPEDVGNRTINRWRDEHPGNRPARSHIDARSRSRKPYSSRDSPPGPPFDAWRGPSRSPDNFRGPPFSRKPGSQYGERPGPYPPMHKHPPQFKPSQPPLPEFYYDRPHSYRESSHGAFPPRPPAPPVTIPPHLDPDPVRRLDALRKARAEQETTRALYGQELDPDPLKRVLKRNSLAKSTVIDYSHGSGGDARSHRNREDRDLSSKSRTVPSSKKSSTSSWEDDIKSLLGQAHAKKPDGLGMLSNTYSSPEHSPSLKKEKSKPDRPLPFSKSYLDLPQNRQKLKSLKEKARSPPIPGMEKIPKDTGRSSKAISVSSSSTTSSPDRSRDKKSRSRSPTTRKGPDKFSQHKPRSLMQKRSRSPKEKRNWPSPPLRRQRTRSPERVKQEQSPFEKRSPVRGAGNKRKEVTSFARENSQFRRSPFSSRVRGKVQLPAREKSPFGRRSPFSSGKSGRIHSPNRKKSPFSFGRRDQGILPPRSRGRSPDRIEKTKERLPFMNPSRDRSPRRSSFRNQGRDRSSPRKQSRDESPLGKHMRDNSPLRKRSHDRLHQEKQRLGQPADVPRELDVKKEPQSEDESEDAQAERIADMLLKMTGFLNTSGDTQATLQALLSNPDVAQTLLDTQSKLASNPPTIKKEKIKPPDASTSRSQYSPEPQSHHQPRPAEPREAWKKQGPPPREKVAFSLSGARGSLPVNHSAAFNASSSDEDN